MHFLLVAGAGWARSFFILGPMLFLFWNMRKSLCLIFVKLFLDLFLEGRVTQEGLRIDLVDAIASFEQERSSVAQELLVIGSDLRSFFKFHS